MPRRPTELDTRIAKADILLANLMAREIKRVIYHHGADLDITLPFNFPEPLVYPCGVKTHKERGEIILNYTMYMLRIHYQILREVYKKRGYDWNIQYMSGQPQRSYFVSVSIVGKTSTSHICSSYFQAQYWILKKLMEFLPSKVK